ncbi:hypothetical protein JTE90_014487 [Oedothorax gibbosus]|uniref:C2H2-type domain-containing protein n=1 Tax=Oedothorax gibbosus TaxID=931172 RepID=A0AAV6VJ66_9ARAC|nr:hypothetical protein JTE90_014487 [Oedothorax gibbosus]
MSLTCLSCKLLFSVAELHQEHYKTDWHRYNLKRRLADLPPLTKDDFDRRAAAFKEDVEGKEKKVSSSCEYCNKHFATKNAMVSHLQSKKHKMVLAAAANSKPKKPVSVKTLKSSTVDPKPSTAKESNPTATVSTPAVSKPTGEASMEIDDEEWSDEGDDGEWESCSESDENDDGAVQRVVVDTNDCLFCDHQSESTEANVLHMTTEHSFFIPDVEYLADLDGLIGSLAGKIHLGHICLWCNGKGRGFKSVKSVKQHMLDKGHCKMLHEGNALIDYADFYDYSSIDVTKEIGDVNVIDELLEDPDFELVLPSGATIGHRSLAVYYKQNLKPVDSNTQTKVKKVLQHYKALGYLGTTGASAVKKARDLSYVKHIKDKYYLKLGMKQNKFQPHFRNQILF